MPSIVPPTSDTQDDDARALGALFDNVRLEHLIDVMQSGLLGCTCGASLPIEYGDDGRPLYNPAIRHHHEKMAEAVIENAVEMARKADLAERRAEQLRDALDRAEAELESLTESAHEQIERVSLHAAEVAAERDAALTVLAEIRRVFDLQCPPMRPDAYVDAGAWMAHSWWNTVLGSVLKRAEKGRS